MKPIRINVTARDIAKGKASNYAYCPIARAGKRAFKTKVTVGGLDLFTYDAHDGNPSPYTGQIVDKFLLPEKAAQFIQSFDRGLAVEPFFFEITEKRNP